jgi:hypothetical protein
MISLVAQFVLGYMYHWPSKRTEQPSRLVPIHVWLGRIVIVGGVANGFV